VIASSNLVFHRNPGDRVAARRHVGIATDGPVIVWAGRLVPVKAVDTLLEAFSTLLRAHPNARLFLLGSGPLRGDLELLAKSLGTGDSARFMGAVPHDSLGHWLRAANVVALSSESEGMPNVLLEAAACDIPFVASDVGGIRELADPAIDRLVRPRDSRAFAAALTELIDAGDRVRPRRVPPPTPAESIAALDAVLSGGLPQAPPRRIVLKPRPMRQLARRWLAALIPRKYYALSGTTDEPCVYLTFDDGPDPAVTPQILDALRDAGAVATFFLIGDRAERFPALVQRIAAEGHELAHHSYWHLDPRTVSSREFRDELRQCAGVFAAAGLAASRLVRPPNGKLTPGKLLRLWAEGYGVVLWNRDPRDYIAASADDLANWFEEHPLNAGDIILLHDTKACTAESLPRVIASIRRAGLRLATVSGAVGHGPKRSPDP
jgi:peptidoglycan/xylan/chitin deacetylase (PgdA/CDA1 family)